MMRLFMNLIVFVPFMRPPTPFSNLPNSFADELLHVFFFGFALAVCNSIPCLWQLPLLPALCVLHFPFVQCVSTIFVFCILVNLLFLWLLHSQSWCRLSWIVFYLLVAPCYVAFCHVLLVGSPLEVIASFCDCLIVFCFWLSVGCGSPLEVIASFHNCPIVVNFLLPVAQISPLELVECWEDLCFVGSRLHRWQVVGALVLPATFWYRPVSWFLLWPVVLHVWLCLHV